MEHIGLDAYGLFSCVYRMEYLTTKMCKAEGAEKEELQKQIALLEKDITEIRFL